MYTRECHIPGDLFQYFYSWTLSENAFKCLLKKHPVDWPVASGLAGAVGTSDTKESHQEFPVCFTLCVTLGFINSFVFS